MWLGPGNTPGGRCEVQRRDNNERVDERWRRQDGGKGCHLPGGSRPMSAPGKEASATEEQGRGLAGGGGQEVNVQELPCLLGIRHLLTHLEPLVHPKYTPAKKVTMETMVSSGSLPHIQTQWRGTALPRPFPMSIHPAAALLEKRAAPSPRGAWVGKVGPLGGQSQLSCRSAWGCSGG